MYQVLGWRLRGNDMLHIGKFLICGSCDVTTRNLRGLYGFAATQPRRAAWVLWFGPLSLIRLPVRHG